LKSASSQFLGLEKAFTDFNQAAVVILPVPYEGGVSYGKGTAQGPSAVIQASHHLELYDEVLKAEPFRMGIATLKPLTVETGPECVQEEIYRVSRNLLNTGKFVVLLGGDHSITSGHVRALREKADPLGVIQLDAHTDLRDAFEGSRWSHACAMARVRELTPHTLQIGIRSLSAAEAEKIDAQHLPVCTMNAYRQQTFDLKEALAALPDMVYLSLDVDVFDWSVVRSTGTPEPGGLQWDEAISLLREIMFTKTVIGFDIVELADDPHDINSPFAVAKLLYKMLGFRLAAAVQHGRADWPQKPQGNLF
jgi:agmatinase